MNAIDYPWYASINNDEIEQGDIFEDCPVFLPPEDLDVTSLDEATFEWEERDLIVMSQTCDMVKGRVKIDKVLLCAIWKRSELTEGHLSSHKGMEDARRGNLPAFHILAECDLPRYQREVRVVDFRRVYSLPIEFMRKRAQNNAVNRIRLLPPYREHLSQAFARFFMRVGLPVDIAPFKKK